MASNPVVNTLTFTGSVAGQASISAQGIAGGLTFLLPNTVPVQGQLLNAVSINGNNVFLGWASAQSLSNIPLSALSPTGASNGDVIQLVGGAWTFSAFVPGAGTVTSVAFTTPAELSIAGSPITTAGTLALSWASGTGSGGQGKVIATPSGGGAGAYAGRVLVAGDIPALAYDASGAAATAQSNAEAFATSADTTVLATAEAYVQTIAPVTSNFLTGYNASTGVFSAGTVNFTDLAGSIATGQIPASTITIAQINSKEGSGTKVQTTNAGTTVTGNIVTYADTVGTIADSDTLLSSLASSSSVTSAVAAETSRAEAAEALLASLQGSTGDEPSVVSDRHIATGNNAALPGSSANSFIAGAVSTGAFVGAETVTQTTSGATATTATPPVDSQGRLIIVTASITGSPDPTDIWTGGTSGATFTPTADPVALTSASYGTTITLTGAAAYSAGNAFSVQITRLTVGTTTGILSVQTVSGSQFTVFSNDAADTSAFFWTCFGKNNID